MTERIECLCHLPVKWNDRKKMDLYVVKDEQLFIILYNILSISGRDMGDKLMRLNQTLYHGVFFSQWVWSD